MSTNGFKNGIYWDGISKNWWQTPPQHLLRLLSDIFNQQLYQQWLPQKKTSFLLKTDLFDESLTRGLYPLLSKSADNILGIDISKTTVRKAGKQHKGLQTLVADIHHLPFSSNSFGTIVSNSTLDHFETSDEIIDGLKELKRVLRVNGQLLITLDNLTNPIIFLRSILPFELLNRFSIVPYFTGVTFSAHHLKRELEKLGFSVSETTAFWHFPRILIVAIITIIDRFFSNRTRLMFLKIIFSFESLSKLPSKFLTGQFVAAKAIKRS